MSEQPIPGRCATAPRELILRLDRFELGAIDEAVGNDTDQIREEIVADYFRQANAEAASA